MALTHARPLDVIDAAPLGSQLPGTASTSLIKTDRIQLLHLVLAAQQVQQQHHVEDECVLHCLEGDVDVVLGDSVRRLLPGQLVVLPPREPHALRARAASAVLVTLLLRGSPAPA